MKYTSVFIKCSLLQFEFCVKWYYNGPSQEDFITRTRLEMEIKSQNSPV